MTKKLSSFMSSAAVAKLLARLKADQKGNVLMIMGFAIVPLTFAIGFGIDYARAMSLQTQLNAAADAAVLAAVSPAMVLRQPSDSTAAATNMFNSQAALLSGYQDLQMTPTITDSPTGSGNTLGYLRKATVSYTVKSINVFGGILGANTLTVSGTATASAAQPPNVDFYLAMDNSPSMLLPATSDGVSKIIAATKDSHLPNGCAFACHAQVPHSTAPSDNIYIKDTQSRWILLSTGYYTAGSSKLNTYYRWDNSGQVLYDSTGNPMNSSTTSVSGPTTTTKTKNGTTTTTTTTVTTVTTTTYSIPNPENSGPITINQTISSTPTTTTTITVGNGTPTTTTTVGNTTTGTPTTYDTGYWADGYWLTHNYGQIYGTPTSITLRKDDMVSAASQLIPFAAGQANTYQVTYQAQMFSFDWTRSGGSSPVKTLNTLQNVSSYGSGFSAATLFPADDYWWKNSQPTSSTNINDQATEMTNMLTTMKNLIPTAGTGAAGATPQKILFIITDGMVDQGSRYFGPLQNSDLTQCTAIKAKGIKIAILYTQYLPDALVGDPWSQTNVAPFLSPTDQVLTALQSCASPGINGSPLVQTVTANDNITTALQQLFSTALQTARLVQ